MDLPGKLEIYIPVEAEVKSIPLWSLPRSVLRRMGLPLPGSKGSEKLLESPEGIWICPAVIRRKGQKVASHAGTNTMENLSSQLGREFRANPGPVQMSFVAANLAVYKALKDTMPGKKVSAHTSHASPLPRGSAPRVYKDAVILYNGQVYLSIRNPNESRTQQPETREQQLASQSSIPSTSDVSSKSLKKRRSPPVSLGPAELQRKKSHVTLPQTSSKQLKDRLTKPENHSTTDQELLHDNRTKERRTTPKAAPGENKKVAVHRGSDVSSTTTTHHAPQSASSRRHKEGDGQQAAEEAAGAEWLQPQGEANNNCGEHEMVTDEEEADYTHGDSGEPDNTVGIVEQSGSQSWPTRKPQECDFKQLAEEEKIARMKRKLEQKVAALNNLPNQ